MDFIIVGETVTDSGGIFIELTSGKVTGVVGYSAVCGNINVLCVNAAHKTWRGGGRYFRNFTEALAAYRSPEMKAFILYLRERVAEKYPDRFTAAVIPTQSDCVIHNPAAIEENAQNVQKELQREREWKQKRG